MATLTQSKAKIGIEYLAPEVLLMIATQLPDLLSLDSLLKASPNTFRLFNSGNAVKITEAVLSARSTHPHVRVIICVIALIRSSSLPIHNLDDFRRQVTLEAIENRTPTQESGFSPMHLSPDTTPAVLRSVLASVRRITCLARDCLEYYLYQFRSLKPQHVVNRTFQLRGYQPWGVYPERQEYPKQEVGPPSWTEEQRVFRAFWRIQVICDLKTAASYSMLYWPTKDLEQLHGEGLIELFYDEFLLIPLYRDEPHPEFEEIRSVMHYAQSFQAEGFIGLLGQSQRSQEVQREWPSLVPSKSDWVELNAPSPSCDYYYFFVNPGISFIGCGFSPLCNISFDPFRRRGFAFWDLQRMSAYGLLPLAHEPVDEFQLTFYLLAWHSILSADEVAQQERQNMAAFAGSRW